MANNLDRDMMQKIVALVEELQSGGASIDVQINGVSIVDDGVANIPKASSDLGVVRFNSTYGATAGADGEICIQKSTSNEIKGGSNQYKPVVPQLQHEATFYGLAKAAGDSTQSESSNHVGQYTDTAKEKIRDMLGMIIPLTFTIDTTTDPDYDIYTLNKTAGEIITALTSGAYVSCFSENTDQYGTAYTQTPVVSVDYLDSKYQIALYIDLYNAYFQSETLNDPMIYKREKAGG